MTVLWVLYFLRNWSQAQRKENCGRIICNILSVKKRKKKNVKLAFFLWITCVPTTHFHPPLFSLLAGSLFSFFHFLSFLFTETHTHSLPHSPTGLNSKPHHLTIIFPTRSPEKYLGTPKHLHHFYLR